MTMGTMTTTATMGSVTTITMRAAVRGERAMGRVRGGPRARAMMSTTTTRASMGPELKANIDAFIAENKVVLFMKGTKEAPRCGFSNTCVQILQSMNVPFADVDILSNEDLRQGMKDYSNWPTFPQLYIGGEFFGGCDITVDAFKDGSLKEELERAMLE
jgi:monothiol glutaredoxin